MATKRIGLVRGRKAAGYTQETLAYALHTDTTTVGHWKRGRTEPLPYRRPKLAKLLGITLTQLEELLREGTSGLVTPLSPPAAVARSGAPPPATVAPPGFAGSLDDSLASLDAIAQADEGGFIEPHATTYFGNVPALAIRAWRSKKTPSDVLTDGVPASVRDIDEIITTTKSLDQLDRQFGGDYSRDLAVKYLTGRVLPLLRRPASDSVRRELFQASAVLCEVIGYMAYDAQLHGLAQHYFVQSLRLAKEADNPAYGSFVLATMSHQALYLDRPDQALTLAQAAGQVAPAGSLPVVTTEAAMLEATASAALGDHSGSTNALRWAEAAYGRYNPTDETPYWMAHWDDAVFASFASSAWLDLGNSRAAEPYLQMLWTGAQGQARRQVFAAGQFAKAALREQDVEQCAHYGTMAAEAAAAAGSKRSHRIVRDLLGQLDGHRQLAPVRELGDTVAALLPSEGP